MYTFDRVSVCLESREVFLGGQRHSLSTRAFDILELLINARGRLVTKDEIMRVVWPRTFVVDNNIHVHVCELRKLFGGKHGWIRTDSGRGYRLTPPEPREREPRTASPEFTAPHALVGRERELAELHALVDSEALLTLVGAPGIGKSSLARELVRERASTGDMRTFFIDLADAAPGTSVVGALATAFGLPLPHDRAAIVATVAQRPALIVFDGCDRFIDEVASLCQTLSTFGTRIHLVATSREPLQVSAERTWRVPPLGTPDAAGSDADVAGAPAVRLFMQRLQETLQETIGDGARQTGEQGQNLLNVVASLCRRVGGNPLALEVAAARAATLGPLGMLELTDEQWLVLGNARRDAPARHRSLAAAYAWSCARLAAQERSALSRLAALPDSFTIETACAIAGHGALDNEQMLDALASLVSKSLVEVETTSHLNGRRYRLPHTLRAFMHSLPVAGVSQPGEASQAEDAAIVIEFAPRPREEAAIDSLHTPPVCASRSFTDHPAIAHTATAHADVAVPVVPLRPGKSPVHGASPPRRDRRVAREPANHLHQRTCDGRAKIAASCRVPSVFCLAQGKRRTQRERS